MKTLNVIVKLMAALAAIAGVVYVVATYGDKIVAWAKKLLGRDCDCCCDECDCEYDCDDCQCEGDCDECECGEAAEEITEEAEESTEEPAEEIPADENAVEASDADFEG